MTSEILNFHVCFRLIGAQLVYTQHCKAIWLDRGDSCLHLRKYQEQQDDGTLRSTVT